MSKEPKELYSNMFFSLYSDGKIGCSDGVGFIGVIGVPEVDELYEALKELKGAE